MPLPYSTNQSTVMELTDIYNFLRMRLSPDSSKIQDQEIDNFLLTLNDENEIYSARLLCCIGIDIKAYDKKFGSNSPEVRALIQSFRDVILNIKKAGTPKTYVGEHMPPYAQFAFSITKMGMAHCIPQICSVKGGHYTKVTNFFSYLKYIVHANASCNIDITADIDLDKKNISRYYKYLEKRISFHNVNVTRLSSLTGWVFAADISEMQKFYDNLALHEAIDSVGYYVKNLSPDDMYVYLEYPSDFDEQMHKPTALTGDWGYINEKGELQPGNDYFMSDGDYPDWGRTYSVSGKLSPVKERLHPMFDYNGSKEFKFKVGHLGPLIKPMSKATDSDILIEALNRFNNA